MPTFDIVSEFDQQEVRNAVDQVAREAATRYDFKGTGTTVELAGAEIKLKFNDPATDRRTPDILVQPVYGTIYTTSKKKNEEHGGFSFGDTNVGLIVSNPDLHARVIKTPVATSQVAPTILRALGLDPSALKSVRREHTHVLPGLPE